MGSTSEAVRSCTQVSLGACRLAQLLGVLQSGGAGALSAGSLNSVNNANNELQPFMNPSGEQLERPCLAIVSV